MGEFKRSPSKVWWGNDSLEWRTVSSSPGSQDSGFSDTETSPHLNVRNLENNDTMKGRVAQRIPKDIFKDLSNQQNNFNISSNYKEKSTPQKCMQPQLTSQKASKIDEQKIEVDNKTTQSEPSRKNRFIKYSPKVSRSLFSRRKNLSEDAISNQYSQNAEQEIIHACVNSRTTFSDTSLLSGDSFRSVKSLPNRENKNNHFTEYFNKSAPAILREPSDDEGVTAFNGNSDESSECESEFEYLFDEAVESPKHTSTPKAGIMDRRKHKKLPLHVLVKCHKERVPPIHAENQVENKAIEIWMEEVRKHYEPECMTSLQCKSISAELTEKVSYLASSITSDLTEVISYSRFIEAEHHTLNNGQSHIGPIVQSLAGNIMDFLKLYKFDVYSKMSRYYDEIKSSNKETALKLVAYLFDTWQSIQQEIYSKAVKNITGRLEDPASEIDLRATVTGIISLGLQNEQMVELFIKSDIVPILLILCEKCEGSSLRCLILRALSTMCCVSIAVRQFEKFSGIQIVADTLAEESRPEPERCEAVTLLAQVTAPWIEDNNSVRGLQDYSKKLIKSLTKFIINTKCCQNLLLCSAALANLSAMDPSSIKFILRQNSIKELLNAVNKRGSRGSIYLFEQVATLIANVSAVESARSQLTDNLAPAALLSFLRIDTMNESIERRLQQKAIIGLSRLCGDTNAAKQIVELGGVNKLVKLCREKNERYNSDAVLVATLATLRKISESCGSEVISSQDSQELVEPKLLDSFLAYSTQNESYV